MHLNKYIALCGITSRRKAVELIKNGSIRVNNTVITDPSTQILPDDIVMYQGSIVRPEKKVYILLNKPKGFISTHIDPEGRPTVFDLLPKAIHERLFSVGRLDANTTGLLLLTNDGDLGQALAHPKYNIKKTYQVALDRPLEEKDYTALSVGIRLEDGFIKADHLAITPKSDRKKIVITIHSGKKHIVRRMFKHLGYFITKLDRTGFGSLTKKGIALGRWRYVTKKEVEILQPSASKSPSIQKNRPKQEFPSNSRTKKYSNNRPAPRGKRTPQKRSHIKRTNKK